MTNPLEDKSFRWLFDAADAMLIADSGGSIRLANPAAERLFGHTQAEFEAINIEDLIPQRFRAKHAHDRADYKGYPRGRVMGAGLELCGLRRDGSEFAADVSLSPIGEGITLATVHDVSARRHAERTVIDQAALLELTHDAILVRDMDDRISYWNRGAEERYGWMRQEALGEVAHALLHTEFPLPLEELRTDLLRDGRWEGEVIHTRHDGTKVQMASRWALVRATDGTPKAVLEINSDVTARRRAEKRQVQLIEALKSANEELQNFAYVVSHDLKAPLRAIGSLSDWLVSDYADKLDDQGREYLGLLKSRVIRMDALIDGILQHSRVGRVHEALVPVDVNALVREIIDLLAPPPHIRVIVETALPTLKAERTRIQQVFQNLISNAIKYLDKPEGSIRIGCIDDGAMWRFSIADNGPGIEARHFERIFQLFQTLAPKDRVESSGVGLALVKKIVELYGGQVWLESEVGQGSTFFFTLPKQ
ncbi:MAG: PAS domain S-box protein [Pseudomonadota bacterium]|nr:PAS domain S-box protein [Pseudomonadota bacterium]